jgi:gliding motility-associated-like protein
MLEDITPSQAGVYHAVARLNDCQSGVSADFKLTVNANQTGFAFAGEDKVVCPGGEKPLLQAAQPVNGSGHWISLDGAVVMQPNQATSFAANLHPGSNRFVWTLTNGLCPGAGSDTVDVFVESIEALPESMSVPFNGSLLNINLLENDALENAGEWEFFILKKTTKGELEEDGAGNITYTPYPNVFGVDELTYLLCSKTCPELCDTARVQFKLEGPANPAQCFVPNLISPNGDGENDVFIVPCTASYTGSSMTVFNRWGAIVYETGNYQNDWNGSYDGQPLPAGTYFYLLTLNDGAKTKLQGYITVVR